MCKNKVIDKSTLENLYLKHRLGSKLISDKLKISRGCVRYWLKEYKIPLRKKARQMELTGHKFFLLTAIRPLSKRKNKQRLWECRCDCGNTCYVLAYELNKGHRKSCGCLHKLCGSNSPLWRGYGELSQKHFNGIKLSAKFRKLDFSITIEYLWNLFLKQNKKCALSGIELQFKKNHKNMTTASLDRIDSSKGYIEGNVQWVHKDVNLMKQKFGQQLFLFYCETIAKYHRRSC